MEFLSEVAAWQVWVALALLILAGDLLLFGGALSAGGGILPILAGGAVGAFVATLLGLGFVGQLAGVSIGMGVAAGLFLWLGRAWTGRSERNAPADDRITGKAHQVIEHNGQLGVRLLGDFFPIETQGTEVSEGDTVEVIEFQGIRAVVRRTDPEA
ncbi:NfeD-like partner-binding protein [Alkalispirillum mobile]|uniref:NfeD-like partner-binding protein n=1 Tax=Alkalispirillum mobile TaxID=85925 RepID=A0A498C4E0_9GAMM|nr:NfeD family protein [Alkalispirillum mobile]RLK50432.1 NfeD-like partner-binding protein [Alkalispirillum mobile]